MGKLEHRAGCKSRSCSVSEEEGGLWAAVGSFESMRSNGARPLDLKTRAKPGGFGQRYWPSTKIALSWCWPDKRTNAPAGRGVTSRRDLGVSVGRRPRSISDELDAAFDAEA
jgi:hypothetical protein